MFSDKVTDRNIDKNGLVKISPFLYFSNRNLKISITGIVKLV